MSKTDRVYEEQHPRPDQQTPP